MSQPRTTLIGLDDGYEYTKVIAAKKRLCLPTAVSLRPRTGIQLMAGARELEERHYEIDGVVYAVGADVREPMDTRYDEFPFSPASLAVTIDAIRQAMPYGGRARVVTGLPIDICYRSSGVERDSVEVRKLKAWSRDIRSVSGLVLPEIVDVSVIGQAVAAWYDYIIGPDLQPTERINECVVVVDIGGRTTDVAVFEDGKFDAEGSGTLNYGVLQTSDVVKRAVKGRFPNCPLPSKRAIADAVRDRVIRVQNTEIALHTEMERAIRRLVEQIVSYISGLQGGGASPSRRLLFVGGGSVPLKRELQLHFPEAEFAANAQLANAHGMYLYGRIAEQAEQTNVDRGS